MKVTTADLGRRLHGAITRGRKVQFSVDGHAHWAFEGETVAAALLAAGQRTLRSTARRGEPRGMYCGIGVCFDCVMTVDGRPNVRACQAPVRAGMRIESQTGDGAWGVETFARDGGGRDEIESSR